MGVEIAIIDSGINPRHSHVGWISGGLAFLETEAGNIQMDVDYSDRIGHGTAVAGIIRENNPEAELIAVKIFTDKLKASLSQLLAALEWAIERNTRIIHLSLGIDTEDSRKPLQNLCEKAVSRNLVIIASGHSPDVLLFPASFESTIGVCGEKSLHKNELIFHPDSAIEFSAYAYARGIPGIPRESNFQGHSFAAAHVTTRCVSIMAENPDLTVFDLKSRLAFDLADPISGR